MNSPKIILSLAFLVSSSLFSQPSTWTGGGEESINNPNWSYGFNWDGGFPTGNDVSLNFHPVAAFYHTVYDDHCTVTGVTNMDISTIASSSIQYKITGRSDSPLGAIPMNANAIINVHSFPDNTAQSMNSLEYLQLHGPLTINLTNNAQFYLRNILDENPSLPLNSITITGDRNSALSLSSRLILVGEENNYKNTTMIGGILSCDSERSFPQQSGSVINLQGSCQLDLGQINHFIPSLIVDASSGIVNDLTGQSFNTLTVGGDGSSSVIEGQIGIVGSVNIALEKVGPGSLKITTPSSGSNLFTGGVLLSGGTLITQSSCLGTGALTIDGTDVTLQAIASSAPTISNSIILASNGTIDCNGEIVTLSGVISGSGDLILVDSTTGNGAFNLTNSNNNYTGELNVGEGTLNAGANNVLPLASGVNLLTERAILKLSSGVQDYSQTIASLNGCPSSKVELGAASLTVGTGAFAGLMSGSGSFIKSGSGTFSLTGVNSDYTGTTLIQDGILEVGNSLSLGTGDITLADLAKLKADGFALTNRIVLTGKPTIEVESGSLTFEGSFSGGISLQKEGLGTLKLTSANNSTGAVFINRGELAVLEGTMTSPVSIAAGCTLSGTGKIVGKVTNRGTLAPGASIGTLTIIGDYIQGEQSVFRNEINGTSSDQLIVQGNVKIENQAIFALIPEAGAAYTTGSKYDVITTGDSGAILGQFAKVTTTNSSINGLLTYFENRVALTVFEHTLFPSINFRGNPQKVASTIDALFFKGDQIFNEIFHALVPLDVETLYTALDHMHPAMYKGMTLVQENNALLVRNSSTQRLHQILNDVKHVGAGQLPRKRNFTYWATGLGDFLQQSAENAFGSPQAGYQSKTGGAVLGMDCQLFDQFYVGAIGGYTHSGLKWSDKRGQGSIQSGYSGLYVAQCGSLFYGNFSLTGAWSEFKALRNIVYPTVAQTAWNSHLGKQLTLHIESGMNYLSDSITVRPFDSLDWMIQHEDGYAETGGGQYNLHVQSSVANMLRNELGLSVATDVYLKKTKFTFDTKAGWVSEVRLNGKELNCKFVRTDTPFAVVGNFPNRNLFKVGGAMTTALIQKLTMFTSFKDGQLDQKQLKPQDILTLTLYYNGLFGKKYQEQSFGGQFNLAF